MTKNSTITPPITPTITLITGATKGIGHETARQLLEQGHVVYLGARDAERGRQAAAALGARSVQLDVTDDASVRAALATIESEQGRLDVLVHNAGVMETEVTAAAARRSFDTNAIGIVAVTEAALPLLQRSARPTMVIVSSSMGSFWAVTNPDRVESTLPIALYAASKSAATMLAVQYAKAHPEMLINAVEPGATATDMTAAWGIGRPVTESARVVVRFATLGADGPTGTLQDESGVLAF